MAEFFSILPCICKSISIIEELIDIRAKMKINDPTACGDLVNIIKNYESYSKKEQKLIRSTLKIFLEQNSSLNNSSITIGNASTNNQEMKYP